MAQDVSSSAASVRGDAPHTARVWVYSAIAAVGVIMELAVWAQEPSPSPQSGALWLVQRQEANISVAATILAVSDSQIVLPIQVGPPEVVPKNSFVRLRGLPPSVSLSEGHSIGPGSWAIPLFALAALKANIPTNLTGRSALLISLVDIDGELIAEAASVLIVVTKTPLQPPQEPSDLLSAPVPAVGSTPPAKPSDPPGDEVRAERLAAEAERYVARGERYLSEGNVAVARQFFRRAADAGYARGALRLAATYDPSELSAVGVRGVMPDPSKARTWYERARELGAPEASERLGRLMGK
jgi:hypothetical protein